MSTESNGEHASGDEEMQSEYGFSGGVRGRYVARYGIKDDASIGEDVETVRVQARPTESVTLTIPADALEAARQVAATRGTSLEALLELYIGEGLRRDSAHLLAERILETTAEVLARHIVSEEERSAILREIRSEAAA